MMRTYGRKTIYVDLTEEQLNNMSNSQIEKAIMKLMPNIIEIHESNKAQSKRLWDYYLGIQDILYKVKHTRKNINNKIVENWAYAFTEFKKCWLLGKPIQYTMLDESSSNEIGLLNKYARLEGKKRKDQEIYEDCLVVGRGFRFQSAQNEEDEAPFELSNIDREHCEVVYSSKLGKKQLFSVIETELEKTLFVQDEMGNTIPKVIPYSQYTIYLKNFMFVLEYGTGRENEVIDEKPIIFNTHLITEYYLNRDRISMIELGKNLFDNVNRLESLDTDDMEQFVNAILVFTNASIDEEGLNSIEEMGAVSIKSTENKQAKVEMLQQRLNASDTQTFYTRLLTSLHQILGIPMANDSGSVTSSDTGKGKLVGQGYTSAGIRALGDETMLEDCDRRALKVTLKICKLSANSDIKNLLVSDVDIKFNRDMSENLLVKTQGLMNLLSCDIPREYALPIVNLFSDSNAVVKSMNEKFGEQTPNNQSKDEEVNIQNNKITKVNQVENQEQ